MLLLLSAPGVTVGVSQNRDCPPSSFQVPEELARGLLIRMLKNVEMPPNEQEQALREAEHREGGISSIFCAEAVDLNRDGRRDLLIHNAAGLYCGGMHNCTVWVYRRMNKGYQMLLEDEGGYLLPIIALRTSTNGYRDIRVQYHDGANYEITIYKFDGRRYRAHECFTETRIYVGRNRGKNKYIRHKCD
jgi:hypothetical protein